MATSWRLVDPLPVPYRLCPTVAAHESSPRCGTGPATCAKLVVVSNEKRVGSILLGPRRPPPSGRSSARAKRRDPHDRHKTPARLRLRPPRTHVPGACRACKPPRFPTRVRVLAFARILAAPKRDRLSYYMRIVVILTIVSTSF